MQPILVFGARLKENGTAHPVLKARMNAAVACGKMLDHPLYIVSGGNPKAGITEAYYMKQFLLQSGIDSSSIICEDQSTNTIQSVRLSSFLLKKMGFCPEKTKVRLVSSAYHQPRCQWLMFLEGWHCVSSPPPLMNASRSFMKSWKWRLREIPAIIWDSLRFIRSR